MSGKCETLTIDAAQLARILTRYERVDPNHLSRRFQQDEDFPIDGVREDGRPGTFAWRFRLKAAQGIMRRESEVST